MPLAPMRPCPVPGCPNLIRSGRCDKHGGAATVGHRWDTRPPVQRIRGRQLQALRRELLEQEPICRVCRKALATIRDHIINLEEGGTEDEANCQPLCQACSDAKTHAESMRGQRRGR